ncbi:MAG TPA: type II secretion system protein [Bacillus bacterium]|nr:type II secretion system protein [Bacillus sp. (in: firmicutes)]
MLKNGDGFSVIEVLGSFAIFLILITMIIPILLKTYEEKTVINYKREALLVLHNEKESFLYDGYPLHNKVITAASRSYQLTILMEGNLTKLCIEWKTPWGRKGEVCDYAKK